MTQTDHYGNPLTTSLDAARAAYDQGLHLFLGGEYGAVGAFEAAVAADPGFALGHAGLARARMMGGDMPGAKAAIAQAQSLGGGTDREQSHIGAFALLLSGKPREARAAVEAHVRDHPRDALIAQACTNIFGLIGFSGCTGREAALLAYTASLLPHYGDDWWMMSMHALSLCEVGQVDASLALMERSLTLNPRNGNGAHFKAHALYEIGETAQGRAYLDGWLPDYDTRSVLHGHITWHAALWALHAGDEAAMWRWIDSGIAPGASNSLPINVLTDGAAILYRAEMAGITVDPARWQHMSAYAAQHFAAPGQSFADMHAALAHAMAGDGDRLDAIAQAQTGFAADLVRPVAQTWGLIARGDWQGALQALTPVMAGTDRIGGSLAQRDLLELTWANILMKLGKTDEAQRALSTRRPVLATATPLAH